MSNFDYRHSFRFIFGHERDKPTEFFTCKICSWKDHRHCKFDRWVARGRGRETGVAGTRVTAAMTVVPRSEAAAVIAGATEMKRVVCLFATFLTALISEVSVRAGT